MHTLSSASRTCMASSSAVECTATVGMPSSLHARSTRKAISPRFAIRILSNISLDDHQRFTELDRLAIFDQDLAHRARARGRNLVHGLHRLDDEQGVAGPHLAADLDERTRAGLRPDIGRADHGRGHHARMLGGVDRAGIGRRNRHSGGARGRQRGGGRDHVRMARHPHPLAVALELDLGETSLVEQACKLADQLGVDRRRLLGHGIVLALARHGVSPCPRSLPPGRRSRARSR